MRIVAGKVLQWKKSLGTTTTSKAVAFAMHQHELPPWFLCVKKERAPGHTGARS